MGQKVNPIALRLGIHHEFKSMGFYPRKSYAKNVLKDIQIRDSLLDKLKHAGIGEIIIERSQNHIKLTIHVTKPGIVIGRGGSGLEILKKEIVKLLKNDGDDSSGEQKIELKVEPIKEPNLNARIVATNVAEQLVRRMPHRRIMKQTIEKVMASGAKGVRIVLSGRIAGAEIARVERNQAGRLSLSTIREDIDFSSFPALTKSGYIGVKVWINR